MKHKKYKSSKEKRERRERREINHHSQGIINLFFPNSHSYKQLMSELGKCKETLRICVYQLSHREIVQHILDISKHIKEVKIIIDTKSNYIEERNLALITKFVLFGNNINIALLDEESFMHCKFCIIDNNIVITGSANWTYQAFSANRENVSIIKDFNTAKQFNDQFDLLWQKSTQAYFNQSQILFKSVETDAQKVFNYDKIIKSKSLIQLKRKKRIMKQFYQQKQFQEQQLQWQQNISQIAQFQSKSIISQDDFIIDESNNRTFPKLIATQKNILINDENKQQQQQSFIIIEDNQIRKQKSHQEEQKEEDIVIAID